MMINSQTIGDVRQKIGTGGRFSTKFQDLVASVDTNWATLDAVGTFALAYNAQALGFLAATIDSASTSDGSSGVSGVTYGHTKAEYSTRAAACIDAYMAASTRFNNYDGPAIALGIDWAWNGLSTATQRSYSTWVQTIDNWGNLNNHPADMVNSQVATLRCAELMTGIAFYGAGYVDGWASSKVANYDSRFRSSNGVTHFESFLAGHEMAGDPAEGYSYGLSYTYPMLLYAEESYRTAMGGSKSTHYGSTGANVLRKLPTMVASVMEPLEEVGVSSPGGHKFALFAPYRQAIRFAMAQSLNAMQVGCATGLYHDIDSTTAQLGQWLLDNRTGEPLGGLAFGTAYTPPYVLMMSSVAATASSPTALGLPLAYRCGESRVIIRTDWTDTNAGFISIDTQKWGKGEISPRQSGALVIHRKGPAITKAGTESGNVEFTNNMTGAASMMLFPDRTIAAKQNAQDTMGGTRQLITAALVTGSSAFTDGGTYDFLAAYRQQFASTAARIHYVGQNLVRSYDSTATSDTTYNPTRVSEYWRHVAAFSPASTGESLRAIVFDRTITVSTSYVQTDCLRVVNAPVVTAASTTAGPARVPTPTNSSNYAGTHYFSTGGTHGHTTYANASVLQITSTNDGSSNRVFITPLLPTSNSVVVVGGPSSNGSSWSQDSSGYSLEGTDPYGVRYVPTPVTSEWSALHSGRYRIEITNTTPTSTDNFLKAIEVADGNASQSTTAAYTGGSFVGAKIGTYAAFFNPTGESASSGSVILSDTGTYTTLISGMDPGVAKTAVRGANISDVTVLETGSTSLAWTPSTAGTMRVSIVVATAGSGAGNTVSWS